MLSTCPQSMSYSSSAVQTMYSTCLRSSQAGCGLLQDSMIRTIAITYLLLSQAVAKQVHVVFGNHLDIGFDNIEPYTGYDNNVLNMYFNRYLPLAVDISDYMQRVSPHKDRYIYTTHSYVISLFLECPDYMGLQCPSAATKEKVLRGIQTGAITWHAHPHNAQYDFYDVSLLKFSFELTHNLDKRFGFKSKHTAILRDVPGLSRAVIPMFVSQGIKGISVGVNAGSAPPGVPHYTPFIWRDEESQTQIIAFWHPGGYGGIHGGVYLDPPDQCIQAPGHEHVLCTAWRNDNEGPPLTVLEPLRVYQLLRQEWSQHATSHSSSSSSSSSSSDNADLNVFASSFDAFVDAVLEAVANNNLTLPVITSEIGDTWIFGVQSDPLKTANFRAVSRARAACIEDPKCSSETAAFYEFSRLLLKVPEHTWGVDIKKTLHDFTNYSNADFHACLPEATDNLPQNAAAAAAVSAASGSSGSSDGVPMREAPCLNYQRCIHAWDRQAAYIDWAVKALPVDHPVVQAYSADVAARNQLAEIGHDHLIAAGAAMKTTAAAAARQKSSSGSSDADDDRKQEETASVDSNKHAADGHYQQSRRSLKLFKQENRVMQQQQQQRHYKCGSWKFTLDEAQGALTSLVKLYGPDHSQPGVDWGGSSSSSGSNVRLGQLVYSAYTESSYDFVWNYYAWKQPLPWWFPLDFGKVNSSAAWDKEMHVAAQLHDVYENFTELGEALHQLTLKFTFPQELVQQVGAPKTMWTIITCPGSTGSSSSSSSDDDDDLEISVVWQDKTPTRLPEALWFSFVPNPAAVDLSSWRMHKLGSLIDPQDVTLNGSQSMHAVSEAGIQVLNADRSELLQIKTLDTSLVSPGRYTPFPNGRFKPEMQHGMHFNLMNIIWGTNYVMWVPYSEKDVNMAFRFSIHAERVSEGPAHGSS